MHRYVLPGAVVDNKDDVVYMREVIYNNPATVVMWSDGTKTVCKVKGNDVYSNEAGLAICVLKKMLGTSYVKDLMDAWTPEPSLFDDTTRVTLTEVRKFMKSQNKA